jgi:mono/diheme cytochrome c family protein
MLVSMLREARRRRWLFVVSLLVLGGCVLDVENGRIGRADLGGDAIATGGAAYRARCASCHGLDARGDGPVGPALRVAPPDLTWLAERNGGTFPRDYVIEVVTGGVAFTAHGTRDMPVWSDRLGATDGAGATAAGSVYARRITEALTTYLASLQRRLSARPVR